ncbi:MAG: GspE/PulE family protein [Desulforegulaceae bacterium]|nr:GspE/PulE family protein [Desulforegulaceae bacterium]
MNENIDDIQHLKSEVEYRTKLQTITNKINGAVKLDEILINLKDEITSLFECDRLTIYYVDGVKKELVSRFKTGDEISEIRVPISQTSLAGYCVYKQALVNIENVYDDKELKKMDPELEFDKSWDKKTGFTTRQVLVVPIIYKKFLLGAVQLINKKSGMAFEKRDEIYVLELAQVLGIALHNQKRLATQRRPRKFDYLLENHILTKKELDNATSKARSLKKSVEEILLKEFRISKDDIGESIARYFKVNYVKFESTMPIPGELMRGLKVSFLKSNKWVPVKTDEEGYPLIAIDNPEDIQRISDIKSLFPGQKVKYCFSFKEDILKMLEHFTQKEDQLDSIDEILSQMSEEEIEVEEAESAVSEESSAIVQLVNKIILDANSRNVSDIHIEPYLGKTNTEVRFRIDGSCMLYQTVPYHFKNAIVSRLKIMADLDIAEKRKPQDGKIKFKKFGGKDLELRMATIPTQGGVEDVVLRLLASGDPIPLVDMGFSKRNFDEFIKCIAMPYGIVLVCGPTGSGKTTTLHSALGYINKPERKIWTAEDPVEITQKGLRQVQVRPKIGFDFAAAMRSFLRADPDVIMVGEMRDKETTQIGIEASLTGHLVFSTLHTNSAPETITRLLDMGMDPFNFADAILCIMAQRLVRTLCKHCKEEYHPTKDEYFELVHEYGDKAFEKHLKIPYSKDLVLYRPNGCQKCNQTGYLGRTGLHELLLGSDKLKKLIQRQSLMEELKNQGIEDGMTTLKQDGIDKVFQGKCDLIQVRKVCIN